MARLFPRGIRVACLGAAALCLLAGFAWVGGTGSAWAGTGGGFSVRPAQSDPNDPATRGYFKPVVAPGGTYTNQVILGNTSAEPITFYVSAVDGLTAQNSGAVYANRGDPVVQAGRWVTPDVSELTVRPGRQTAVGFTVKVPRGASPGDHLAGLAFEKVNPQSPSVGNFSVTEILRVVIGVEIRVPGPASFRVDVHVLGIQPQPGSNVAAVMVELDDNGGLLGKPVLTVSLAGPHGYHNTVSRRLDTILPGDIIDYPFSWPDSLAAGCYKANSVATGGASKAGQTADVCTRSSLHGTVTRSRGQQQGLGSAAPRSGLPIWLFVVIALVGVLIGALLRGPRGRRPRRAAHKPVHAFANGAADRPAAGPVASVEAPAKPEPDGNGFAQSENDNGNSPTSTEPGEQIRQPVSSGSGISSALTGPGEPHEPAVPGPVPLPGAPDEKPV